MSNCRFCNAPLEHVFVDLHHQPPSNSFLTKAQLDEPEMTYPLKVFVCDKCFLVQIPEQKKATEIFAGEYPYYSSQSPANVSHAKELVEMLQTRFTPEKVLEIGSNDGYLLTHFHPSIDVLGIEPSPGPAATAIEKGIHTDVRFFDSSCAKSLDQKANLICGVNVLAHQPELNDFVDGLRIALAPNGVIVQEFPHLFQLVKNIQLDTIYAEHFSYFSFTTIRSIFETHGLEIFDVDEIPEHGGSLRIYAQHQEGPHRITEKIDDLLLNEAETGMFNLEFYADFQSKINTIKITLIQFLIEAKVHGQIVAGYGAPAKASTILNYCGLRSDLLLFTVDRSPHKIGKYIPGCHIPIKNEEYLRDIRPDFIIILAWNLREEITKQLEYAREWGCKFLVALPTLEVF